MIEKKQARLRRARQTRHKLAELGAVRLLVHRSNGHMYAQVIDNGAKVVAYASTLEAEGCPKSGASRGIHDSRQWLHLSLRIQGP